MSTELSPLEALKAKLLERFRTQVGGDGPLFVPVEDSSEQRLDLPEQGWPLPGLADLGDFLGLPEWHGQLPAELSRFEGLSLTRLGIDEPAGEMTLAVKWTAGLFPLIPGVLELREPGLSVTVDGFPEIDSAFVSLLGLASLGGAEGAELAIAVELPGLAVSAQLTRPCPLAPLLMHFGLDSAAFAKLEIDLLVLSAIPQEELVSLTLGLGEVWEPGGGLALDQVELAVTSFGGAGTTAGRLRASGTLAGIDVELTGEHLGSGLGWRLSAAVAQEKPVEIGELLGKLADALGDGKAKVAGTTPRRLTLENLGFTYETRSQDLTFRGEAKVEVAAGVHLDLVVGASFTHQPDGSYEREFSSVLTIGGVGFAVSFDEQTGSADDPEAVSTSALVASYLHQEGKGAPPGIRALVRHISPSFAEALPDITTARAIFGYQSTTRHAIKTSKWLFGVEFGVSIDFALNAPPLPVISEFLHGGMSFKLDSLQAILVKEAFSNEELALLPGVEGFSLPAAGVQRAVIATTLALDQEKHPILLALGGNNEGATAAHDVDAGKQGAGTVAQADAPTPAASPMAATPEAASDAQVAGGSDSVYWISLEKNIGPVHFRRIGIRYADGRIGLALDVGMTTAGLTLSLQGLVIDSPLTHAAPHFGLEGIGIDYDGGAVNFAGAFLASAVGGQAEYSGSALIKAETFTLSAIGSYLQGADPSLFIFAFLDYPLGGPPCFSVQGIAGGFAYNRRFTLPKLEDVQHFPLLRALADPAAIGGPNATPLQALEKLEPYVTPEPGEYWFAAGVKATSFELLDTRAILVVEFGHELVISLLGLSTLKLPKEGNPFAIVEMALEVVLKPAQGTLLARAVLTDNSWVIDKACKLSGGFAFALWFDENPDKAPVGDFVLTLGGYHPHFLPPAHYPKVPRLEFNWPVSDALTIKGGAYFALTPAQVMAGGGLDVLFHSGDLRAWFKAQMDVLIGWDPFHYDASIKVSIGASYRLHLLFVTVSVSIELGADLVIWGPPMGGEANVHWFIIGFTVGFGAERVTGVPAIPWQDFEKRLLPQPRSPIPVVRIQATAGISEQVPVSDQADDKARRWIVRPDHFVFSTTSTIPAKQVLLDGPQGAQRLGEDGADFSIRPMQLEDLHSTHTVTIVDLEHHQTKIDLTEHWDCVQRRQSLPLALWGKGPPPTGPSGKDDQLLLDKLLTGLQEARPKHPEIGGPPAFALEEAFVRLPVVEQAARDTLPLDTAAGLAGSTPSPSRPEGALQTIRSTIKRRADDRDRLFTALRALGVDPGTNQIPVGIADDPAHAFEASPMLTGNCQ